MTSAKGSNDGAEVDVWIDGEMVWRGSTNFGGSTGNSDGDTPVIRIDLTIGPEIAELARNRLEERQADGAETEATLEDVLWEFVDIRLAGKEP